MLVNKPGKYVASPKPRPENNLLLSPKKLWAAMATDFGAFSEVPQASRNYNIIGFNDLVYLENDLWSLAKAKKVVVPEASIAGEEGHPLRLEGRLRKQLPTYLRNRDPAYRSSEVLEAAATVADQLGCGVSTTSDRPDVWTSSDEESLRRVHEFLKVLREYLVSSPFLDALRRREDMADLGLGWQQYLLSSIFGRRQRVGVLAVDLGCQAVQPSFGYAGTPGFAAPSLLVCADRLLDVVQRDPSFEGKVLAAFVHLEYHQEHGQYLRAFFLVIPGDMGYRQLLMVRLIRAWQFIVGPRGWVDDCRRHQNKIVASVGHVSVSDEASVIRMRRALAYGIQKDLHMRVHADGMDSFIVRELRPAIFDSTPQVYLPG